MRCDRRGPNYTKLGRSVRYRRSDLDAWVQANMRQVMKAARLRDKGAM